MRYLLVPLLAACVLLQESNALNIQKVRVGASTSSLSSESSLLDVYPYEADVHWGTRRSHEEVSRLYASLFGEKMQNASGVYSVFPASSGSGNPLDPAYIEHYRIETSDPGPLVLGHLFVVSNPIGRFKVHEPGVNSSQGCDARTLMTVAKSSAPYNCRVSTNAGFFNPKRSSATFGECLGNLVVNGVPVRAPGTQNANFGLLKNGSFVAGYIPMEMVSREGPNGEKTSDFETLIAGVVMLVKDGVNFVGISEKLENETTQTTGSITYFIDVVTARTAIGHDKLGNLLIFATDGATNQFPTRGLDLYTMADMMVQFGAINAINLDGGGSTTVVQDSTCINMPTDTSPGFSAWYHFERSVSSIVCIEDPQMPQEPTTPPTTLIPESIPSSPPMSSPQPSPSIVVVPNHVEPLYSPEPITMAPVQPTPPTSTPSESPALSPIISPPSCDCSPSHQPEISPSSPNSFNRLNAGWKALIIILVVISVVSVTLLFAFLFFGRQSTQNYQILSNIDE